jgi:hypothetical protein
MIQPNDTVKHLPSGETWVVCGVRYDKDELIPCGYPFPTFGKISDCDLVKKGDGVQPQEYIDTLKKAGCESFIVPKTPLDELPEKRKERGVTKFSEVGTACGYEESLAFCEAYQKTVPKQLIVENHAVGKFRCPSCGMYFIGEDIRQMTPHCGQCGQKLDLAQPGKEESSD